MLTIGNAKNNSMKPNIACCMILLLMLLTFENTQAQQAIVPIGGEAFGASGQISYSIGQLAYATYDGSTGSAAQGVQQPFEITVITETNESTAEILCTSYPNPTSEGLYLHIHAAPFPEIHFQLMDLTGKLLQSGGIHEEETYLDMRSLPAGIYVLCIEANHKNIKTFKIVKNQKL